MASIGVYQLTVGLIEAIDVYGQFVRMERAGSDIAVRAAVLFFKQEGLAFPSRPPTPAERLAVLRMAALSADPNRALRRGSNAIDVAAAGYVKDAFGADVDDRSTVAAPARLSGVLNASAQPPAVYLKPTAAFEAPINYGSIPPALPSGSYWDPPPPESDPYDVVVMPSAAPASGGTPIPDPAATSDGGPTEPPDVG